MNEIEHAAPGDDRWNPENDLLHKAGMAEGQASIAQFPTIKRDDAQRFLNALDERTPRFTFMMFDDNETRKDKRLARVLHGTLDELYAKLVDYSRCGAGVFVTINTTNFRGRTKECIEEVRSYFSDLDGAPLNNIARLGLVPHMVTQTSPGRYGVFYNIEDAPLSVDNFKRTQQALATLFDSDPSVCDLPRVMRLPGFPHQKDPRKPFVTEIAFVTSQEVPPIYAEAEFQEALAKALAARESKRPLHAGLTAGLRKSPPDWSEGYAEGQRNNECARLAGHCFAQGMSEQETLAECRRANEKNKPPLADSEVAATVANIARTAARKQDAAAFMDATQVAAQKAEFVFDGVPIEPPRMLIKKILPASGVAFIGGQSGAGKTFAAITLGVTLATGTEFFKYQVKERIGVAYIAAEGVAMFAARVAAAKLAAGVKGPIPFAWTGSVPPLQTQQGLATFISALRALDQDMRERFNVRLGVVFIDTVAACFSMQDENSNAEVAQVCNIIRCIGASVDAVMAPIHHYGKDAATGLRGASAWRGTADVVISVTADIDPQSGLVSNRGLAIAKARDAEQGPIAPFRLEYVKLGSDEDGEEFGTCVVRDDPERGRQDLVRANVEKGAQVFGDACRASLGLNEDVQLRKDGPKIRGVDLKHVRGKFFQMYVTGEGDEAKQQAATKRAWNRALKKVPSEYAITKGQDGREWLWLKTNVR
jgi:hypothetical protein